MAHFFVDIHIPEAYYAINLHNKSVVKHYSDTPIEERRYSTQLYNNIFKYTNTSRTIQVMTLLEGNLEIEKIQLQKGAAVILEPGEGINAFMQKMIIAEPKPIV